MSDDKSKMEKDALAAATASPGPRGERQMALRLMPVRDSDQPIMANYTALNVAPGMVFVDFGFIEPAILAALPRVAREGGKLPEAINGKLAARVALGYDAVAELHRQLGGVLKKLSEAATTVARDRKS